MSAHPLFKSFLFDELGTVLDIDYETVIKAASCVKDNIFIIYQRNE